MKCTVIRTAMCGGGLSYDVYVPESECPKYVLEACPGGTYFTRICHGGQTYLDYEHATLPKSHVDMPQGWERYKDWCQHEKQARAAMLDIARRAYPELHKYQGDKLPSLWVCGLMDRETSAEITIAA